MKLDFVKNSSESKWEGGGSASFSYAGPDAAVDVSAAYGHTEDSIGKNATAKLSYLPEFNKPKAEKGITDLRWFTSVNTGRFAPSLTRTHNGHEENSNRSFRHRHDVGRMRHRSRT